MDNFNDGKVKFYYVRGIVVMMHLNWIAELPDALFEHVREASVYGKPRISDGPFGEPANMARIIRQPYDSLRQRTKTERERKRTDPTKAGPFTRTLL